MAKTVEEQIKFWKKQYEYAKNIVDRIDSGEKIKPDSIADYSVGMRAQCVDEANIAVDHLNVLGNFDLTKIQ